MVELNLRQLIRGNLSGFGRRTFSKNFPWTCAFDCFGIHLLPVGKFSQEGDLIAVRLSMTRQRNAKKKIAVLADDIDQERNDERGFLVGMVLKDGPIVVPMSDACLSLPGFS